MAPPFEQCCTSCTGSGAVRAASSALPANDGMFSRTLQTFKHRFLCVICPELLHIYHNCNVDSFLATDEQFQHGMNVDFNRLTNAHFRHTSSNGGVFIRHLPYFKHRYCCTVILIVISIDALFTTDHQF